MLNIFNCDLHNHTCLSPCAELDMHPAAMVSAFLAKGLHLVAITDHNACDNVEHVMRAAAGTQLVVLPGMEVTTKEEAHVLALFGNLDDLRSLEQHVAGAMTGFNDERAFGIQAIVDERGDVLGFNKRLLFGSADIAVEALTALIHSLGGLAIASHIDRGFFSVLSQLGFIPPDAQFDALEISSALAVSSARERYPGLARYPFIASSDAHRVGDIGKSFTRMRLKDPGFDELRLALQAKGGRCVMEQEHA